MTWLAAAILAAPASAPAEEGRTPDAIRTPGATPGASPIESAPPAIHLRVNQLGYRPQDPKRGIAFARTPLAGEWVLIESGTGREVLRRPLPAASAGRWGAFEYFADLDFSAVTRPGRFELEAGGSRSLPFVIAPEGAGSIGDDMLEFMRQQRCGFNPWLGMHCHQSDGRTAYGPAAPGTEIDAAGGWHDAADLLKYLLTSGNATAQLLLAWQIADEQGRSDPDRQSAGAWIDRVDASGQPGANGMPDLLDEARWGLEWMLKLHPAPDAIYHQVADDRDHWGWRLPPDEKADYGWGKGGPRVVYGADGRPQGLGKFASASTGLANLAGRYAAAMGLAWQIWGAQPDHRAFARRCLQAGIEVYRLGRAQEGVQQGNSYGAPYRYAETTWADDMEWGAAELFRATGNRDYLDQAVDYARQAADESWMGRTATDHYQFYPFCNIGHYRLHPLVHADVRTRLAGYYRAGLERCRAAAASNPFDLGVPFIWCSNNLVVGLVTQCLLYDHMAGRGEYRDFAHRHWDWLLGRNPWGVTMWTGVGAVYPRHPHLMTTRLTGRMARGGLVDGPVREEIFSQLKGVHIQLPDPFADFQDARAVYHDDLGDYSTNEPTMDGTASAILMFALLETTRPASGAGPMR